VTMDLLSLPLSEFFSEGQLDRRPIKPVSLALTCMHG
jgi:hypothetical protein